MGSIRLGCSGWSYDDWGDGKFYKAGIDSKGRLPYYAKIFDTVEIDSTFYRLPPVANVAQSWVKRTPDDFMFAVKFPKQITHVKDRAALTEADLQPFIDIVVKPLDQGKKLGPILIQFPASFKQDYSVLEKFFSYLPERYLYAVEFRHLSWLEDQKRTMALLSKYKIANCIVSEKIMPAITEVTADFTYLRWHGLNEPKDGKYLIYDYTYSEDQLKEWVPIIKSVAEQVNVYGYFNNHPNGQAPTNCNQIKKLLGLKVKKPEAGQRSLDKFF
jgi:uncharacterized protein YecE (DUF72 family)